MPRVPAKVGGAVIVIDRYRAAAKCGVIACASGKRPVVLGPGTIATRARIAARLGTICTENTSMTMTMTGRHKTTRIGTLQAPPEAMAIIHHAARLFRKVMEIEHKDQPNALACVFQYHAKGDRWLWGWAPHDAQFLLSAWLRRPCKASSKQEAIAQALANIEWQGREVAARLALLGGV